MMHRLFIMVFVVSAVLFFMSLHFVDLSYNMDSQCMDKNLFGIIQTKEDLYYKGYYGLLLSFFGFLVFFWYAIK